LEIAGRATVSSITEATNVLHRVPWGGVNTASFVGKDLLRPASAAIIAVIGAYSSLASNTIISTEALAQSSLSVTQALVRAFSPWLQVVVVHDRTNPSEVVGASAQRAIRTSPFSFSIQTSEAFAVVVEFTSSVVGARVFTKSTLSVSLLVPSHLTPVLGLVSWGCSGNTRRLTRWLARRLGRWLTSGLSGRF